MIYSGYIELNIYFLKILYPQDIEIGFNHNYLTAGTATGDCPG